MYRTAAWSCRGEGKQGVLGLVRLPLFTFYMNTKMVVVFSINNALLAFRYNAKRRHWRRTKLKM